MAHTHIGPAEWSVITRMLRAGYSIRAIAQVIGKNHSAVSRHVRDNGGREEYDVREVRRRKHILRVGAMEGTRVLQGRLLKRVTKLLKEHQSPEQISGTLAWMGVHIAPCTIYRYIHERAPHLKQYLRQQKGKYRRKRGTKIRERVREQAKKRRIDERPDIVERRGRLGDWEGDTIQGRDKRVRIVTFVDRRSGYLIAYLLPKMRAELLTTLALKYFHYVPRAKRKTFTLDNGPEFSDWERLEKRSGATVYFAYPYHFWERGTNENTNGLLRQYFPRYLDFNLITQEELVHVVKRLNDRPRKRLGFKSPRQIFLRK
jgi:transposase, IS30 family